MKHVYTYILIFGIYRQRCEMWFRCGCEVYMAPRIYTYSLHQIHAQRGTFNASRFSNKSVSFTQFYSCCKINMFCTPHIYVLYNFLQSSYLIMILAAVDALKCNYKGFVSSARICSLLKASLCCYNISVMLLL